MKIDNEEVKRKRNAIYADVEKLCWSWGLYPTKDSHFKLYERITDSILKAYLKENKT